MKIKKTKHNTVLTVTVGVFIIAACTSVIVNNVKTTVVTPVTSAVPTNIVKMDPVISSIKTPVKVNKLTVSKSRVVEVNSEINASILNVSNRLRSLDNGQPIYLLINSPGGSVFDGAQLISQMQAMKSPVYTVCTNLCASMGFIIHQYGTKRYALDRAILMGHPASSGFNGQVPNLLTRASFLQRYVDKFNAFIEARSGISKEEFEKMVSYEVWLDAEDALAKNLLDGVVALDVELQGPSLMLPSDKAHKGTTIAPPIELTM